MARKGVIANEVKQSRAGIAERPYKRWTEAQATAAHADSGDFV
jgi:hypothetical protein